MILRLYTSIFLLFMLLLNSSCNRNESPVPKVSGAGSFDQTMPANNAIDVATSTQFAWGASQNAVHYNLTVSSHSDFSIPLIDVKGLTSNTYTPTVPLFPFEKYYWKVMAISAIDSVQSQNAGSSFTTSILTTANYYVSTSGEDKAGNGAQSNPFKTLAFAASAIPAQTTGTIYLGSGTFIETEAAVIPLGVNIVGSGESSTILSSAGVTLPAGIDPTSAAYTIQFDGSLIQLISPSVGTSIIAAAAGNQTITGFTIDGNNKSLKVGIWVQNRSNVTMSHVTFKELDQRGAVFSTGSKNLTSASDDQWMSSVTIYSCTFVNSGKDLATETLGNLCISGLDGANIYDLTINDNQGYGIKFIYGGYFRNCMIHDSNITVNEYDPKWGEDIAIELWSVGPGNEIYNLNCNTWFSFVNTGVFASTQNMKVHNVKMIDLDGISSLQSMEIGAAGIEVYDSYFQNKGFGMAIWDAGNNNVTIRNNIFYNTKVHGNWASAGAIYINNSTNVSFSNIHIYNNVFDTYQNAVKLVRIKSSIQNVNIENNAFLNVTGTDVELDGSSISNVVVNNNLKSNGVQTPWNIIGAGVTQANNIIGDPGFIKTGDRWDTYYKPSSQTSLVIDKGANVGLPFAGTAPDIGWWEF